LLDFFDLLGPQAGVSGWEARVLEAVARGGARFERVVLTRNRRVIASSTERGRTLRLHEVFRDAPPEVLRALGVVLSSRSSAAAKARARTDVRGHLARNPLDSGPPTPRPERIRRSDLPYLDALLIEFRRVNDQYFGSSLPEVPIHLSGRMRRKLGFFRSEPPGIAISRALCARGAAGEAEETLRHEMIHLWQWTTGTRVGHGADFRAWARRLDVHPRAARRVRWRKREPGESAQAGE
jgi:hypothetical protein